MCRSAPLFLCLVIVLAGCRYLEVGYKSPQPPVAPPAFYNHGEASTAPLPVPEESWWHVFGDSEMNALVDRVLTYNFDIRQAVSRILEVQAQFRQAKADRWPTLDLDAGVSQRRQSIFDSNTGDWYKNKSDSYDLSLPATFELDFWGRLARAEEALRADLLAAENNRQVVAQTAVAEAISLYLLMESLERQIQITRRSVNTYEKSLNVVMGRYNKGLISILDVRQARRTLAQEQSHLPLLVQELGITQHQLAVLSGQYPKTRSARPQPEDYFRHLAPVPAGLPSDLLSRRPDIREADARLKSLNARVGVAKASRFPRITLTGSFGYTSDELSGLFRADSELRVIAAGFVQPLFDAGKLAAVQRAAEARYIQGQIGYARTVLNAFEEVESALLIRQQQLQRRERVLSFLKEARATQKTAQQRYLRGLTDYLTVLDAQQVRFGAERDLVQVDQAIYQNRVALHRAIGGGWASIGGDTGPTMKSGQSNRPN